MTRYKAMVVIVGATAVVGSGVALWAVGAPTIGQHEVFAYLRVGREPTFVLSLGQSRHGTTDQAYRLYKRTQAALIRSPMVLGGALREPGISATPIVMAQEDPLNWLGDLIRVDDVRDSELLKVSLRGSTTDQLTKVLDAVLDSYFAQVVGRETVELAKTLENLEQSYVRKMRDLKDKQIDYTELSRQSGADELSGLRQQLELRQLERMERRIDQLEDQLVEVRVQMRVGQPARADGNQPSTASAELLDARAAVLTETLAELGKIYEEKRDELLSSKSRSVELELRAQELNSLKASVAKIRSEADRLKMSLEQPRWIQIIQQPTSGR